MKVPKKIKNFVILHLVHGWKVRLLHFFLCLGLYFILRIEFFDLINTAILEEIKRISTNSFLPIFFAQILPLEISSLISLFFVCILVLFFNIFYSLKSIRFQSIAYILKFLIINLIGIFFVQITSYTYPFLSLNILSFFESQFSFSAKLSRIIAEYNFVKKTFGKFVNRNILDDLLVSKQGFLSESKVTTIMFSDIRNFSKLSEEMNPSELLSFLNLYFDEMSKVIYEHNGVVDKFIGDSIMAIWNGSNAEEYHSIQAVLSGMKMLKKLNKLKSKNPNLAIFDIGVGINTGSVIIGKIGGNNKFDYTVIGDNVNLASRLEGLNKKYETSIICSQSTVYNCKKLKSIIFRKLDRITVKGKNEVTTIYEPLALNDANKYLKENYEIGLDLYTRGSFEEALEYFYKLGIMGDNPSQIMFERTKTLNRERPKYWNGIYSWNEK
jgi:adenylate cyclase